VEGKFKTRSLDTEGCGTRRILSGMDLLGSHQAEEESKPAAFDTEGCGTRPEPDRCNVVQSGVR